MFILMTAALLSCGEAQGFIDRINPQSMTTAEYAELVQAIKHYAPSRCEYAEVK